jgi:hypothetical protein
MMKALYFRHHELEQIDCCTVVEGKRILGDISDDDKGWTVGVFDTEHKILYMDGFDDIIGQNPATVESRVLRDLKDAGIEPVELESLNESR